jgi:hypothetical protein
MATNLASLSDPFIRDIIVGIAFASGFGRGPVRNPLMQQTSRCLTHLANAAAKLGGGQAV